MVRISDRVGRQANLGQRSLAGASSGVTVKRWGRATSRASTSSLRVALLAVLFIVLLTTSWIFSSVTTLSASEGWQPTGPPVEIPKRIPDNITRVSPGEVYVYGAYSHEPAPMGIADYGVGPNGAYQYFTNSSLGSAYIGSLSTANSSGYPSMSMQLNVNLAFSVNGKQYVYWAQDVTHIDTNSRLVYFWDNIWNSSAYKANMVGSALSGNGGVYQSGTSSFYGASASLSLSGNDVNLAYPATISLELNATVTSSNQPQLTFGYNDGFGWKIYDTVVFKTAGKVTLSGFEVNGYTGNPGGDFYDSELILGGDCCGTQTSDVSSDVSLQLEYWNGHNYQMITNAYNFGSDTAEGIQNTLSQWYYYPANGGLIAEIKSGAGTLGKLWDQSGISVVDIKPGIASGVLYVVNASNPDAVASQYPFTNGEVVVTLQPGYYELSIYKSGTLFSTASYSLRAGQTLHLPLPITKVPVTLSYSIVGGGSGYSPPVLTYTSNGTVFASALGTTPTTFEVDTNSSWAVTSTLPGSSSTERWSTIQPSSGTASSAQTVNLVYYHQFSVEFNFGIIGGGTEYSGPAITYTGFGSATLTNSGTMVWVDSGSSYSYPGVLAGSSSTERWAGVSTSGTISSSTSISVTYYHQFLITSSYSVLRGGSPSAPTFSGISLGSALSATLSTTQQAIWVDSSTTYSVTNPLLGSTSMERWQSSSALTGEVSGALTLSPVYYHQYSISVSYGVVGGGTPTVPVFNYTTFGTANSIGLEVSTKTFWADSGPYNSTNPLAGSTSEERWYSDSGNGSIAGSGNILVNYYHQFYLQVTGGSVGSQWYDSASTALVTTSGVYGRSGGVGYRVISYAIDGGTAVPVSPTTGNLTVPIIMNGPHTLVFNTVEQEEVILDSGATAALNSTTQPTVNGDNYWYDYGSAVQVVLNGVWDRSSGEGNRLSSYSVNGGQTMSVATLGTIIVLSVPHISSPQTITTVSTNQYLLSTPTGSLSSISPPSISGDSGWYDSGSIVKTSYNDVWNVTSDGTRLNAIGYTVDAGARSTIPRSGNGTFTVNVTMDSPHTLNVNSVTQFRLTTSGGFDVKTSVPSPTGDDFFDAGTSFVVSTDYSWNFVNGNTRANLVSYTINGQTSRVARMNSGVFLTPVFKLTKPTDLNFNAIPQYLVSFLVTDGPGSKQIEPTSFEITDDGMVQPVVKGGMWFDNKSLIGVANLVWEGADVRPLAQNLSIVTGPGTMTIRALVFPAELAVNDFLGLPVGGAQVEVTLANGTVISSITNQNGLLNLGLIPIGTFQASVTNLGFTTQTVGDASSREVVPVSIAFSDATVTVAITSAVVMLIFLVAIMARRRKLAKLRRAARRREVVPGAPSPSARRI